MAPEDPICVVPARGTEPGLPKKNFKRLDGKPLVAHTIETAIECGAFDAVYVSTESESLAEVARDYGATAPFLRPERLAAGDTLLYEVVDHAVTRLESEGYVSPTGETPVVVLQPNVPFRRTRDVTRALEVFRAGHEAVISVVEERGFYWRRDGETLDPRFEERTVRGGLEPFYRETGSINVTTPRLLGAGTRVGASPGYVVTDRLSALAVDSVVDLWLAERIAGGPRVVFRVDGGDDIGMGHVSRCLTLAAELEATLRCDVVFVSDAGYDAGVAAIREEGYEVRAIEGADLEAVTALDPDIVFLDVLDTDGTGMEGLHETAEAVITFEDSAGGLVHADIVINALYQDAGDGDNHFVGADYFVLREEFHDLEPRLPDTAERVLLTFGGSDPSGLSILACRAVAGDTDRDYRLVVGPDFDAKAELAAACSSCPHVEVYEAVEDMSAQMAWADLAVASGGRTAYELLATGTPTIVMAHNDREHERMRELGDRGVVEYLGLGTAVSESSLRERIDALASDRERRRELSERGQAFVDGSGARRILDLVHDVLLG